MPARPTRHLTRAFVALTALELVFQVGVLALAIGGLISPEVLGDWLVVVFVVLILAGSLTITSRIVGTMLILRHVGNIRGTGVTGLALSPWSWLALWLPLLSWPALPLWLFATVGSESPLAFLATFVWVAVVAIAIIGSVLLHELWRATAPDQVDHWRFVPLSGVVVGWGVATVVDGLIPAVNPFGVFAIMLLARRLETRMADKLIVVEELGLLAARASATASAPNPAESAS